MLQEAESKQNSDILQQAVDLVKENQRLAREKEQAEDEIKKLAKFCTENPNPVLRIEISGKLLFSNTPGRVLLEDHAIEVGDQVPVEFQKMVSFAHSSQAIKQCETTVGSQTFFLQWVPILNEGYVNVYGQNITRRKKAERALQESETRANEVLNHALEGIISIDEQGTIQSFNPAAERLFGYKPSEILGKNVTHLIPEPFRSAHDQGLKSYLKTGVSKVIGIGAQVVGLRKDGSTFPLDLGISEMYLGETRMFTGVIRDITERKKAEAQKLMQYELTRTFLDSQSLANALPKVLQIIGEFMEWEIGYYWEKVPESDALTCRYAWNTPGLNENESLNELKKISFKRQFEKGTGLPGRVWDKLEPYWIPDVIVDANFPRAPFAKKLGMKSGFGFPVYFKKQFIGVVEIFTRQVCQPDPHLAEMMANLGGQIGQWMRLKKAEEHLDKLNL